MTGSPLGNGVRWARISSAAYEGLQSEWGREAFARAFRLFLDPENYPIVFHCIAGADRTGSLAYILNALLGVSDAELLLDWEITAFNNPNPRFAHKDRYDQLVAGFRKRPGATTAEKVANYVKSVGFTDADIEKFRAIMLEK
jgi:protein-tyrosine phosphatase